MKNYRGSLEIVIHEGRDLFGILRLLEEGDVIQITLKPGISGIAAAQSILKLETTGRISFEDGPRAEERLESLVLRGFPIDHGCLYAEVGVLCGIDHIMKSLFLVWSGIHQVRVLCPVNEPKENSLCQRW